jgi:hypothetical protein
VTGRSTWRVRWGATFLLNFVIAVIGVAVILSKVDETRLDDGATVLTPDEIRAQPDSVLVAVLAAASADYDDTRLDYLLLKLLLEKSGKPFVLGYGQNIVGSARATRNISSSIEPGRQNPEGLTVSLTGLEDLVADGIAAIRIPATGGLLGLRIPCVNSGRTDLLADVRSIQDLKAFLAVQGIGWYDARILREAGLPTYEVDSGLTHNLLNQGRVDYFPRSVTNVELECHGAESTYRDIVTDPYVLIVHPAAWIYLVNEHNEALRSAIESGFNRAIEDGSYAALLRDQVFTPWLRQQVDLPKRRVLYVSTDAGRRLIATVEARYWVLPWDRLERGEITSGAQLCGLRLVEYLCEGLADAPTQ